MSNISLRKRNFRQASKKSFLFHLKDLNNHLFLAILTNENQTYL